jgi:RNA polymerase sigma-70 factor (ECF subfamily)
MSDRNEAVTLIQSTFDRCCEAFCRFFTVRTGGREDLVDDLMQQLWMQARLKCDDLRQNNPEPWLWRIAQNLLRQHWRREGQSPVSAAKVNSGLARSLGARFDTEDLPVDALVQRETQDQLLLALTGLPAEVQELLIGYYFEGRSHAVLASALGVTERSIEGRLYRARLALRDRLAHLDM